MFHQRRTGWSIFARVAVAGVAMIGLTLMVTTPASAATGRARHGIAHVSGTFIGAPLIISNLQTTDGITYSFDVAAGDEWDGDLVGHTTYTGHGTLNISTGEFRAIYDETFTGTVAGLGTGQLHFVEYAQAGPTNLGQVDCLVVGATGDLAGVRGGVEFRATSVVDPDPSGNGTSYGSYTGYLVR